VFRERSRAQNQQPVDANKAQSALSSFISGRLPENATYEAYNESDPHNAGQLRHQAIANLAARFPNLTQEQVFAALYGEFGDTVMLNGTFDPRLHRDVVRRFRA
jgi:hypothetical protein